MAKMRLEQNTNDLVERQLYQIRKTFNEYKQEVCLFQ